MIVIPITFVVNPDLLLFPINLELKNYVHIIFLGTSKDILMESEEVGEGGGANIL